jgi:RNA polymerase sigma-70 factor (ECF subfamily)
VSVAEQGDRLRAEEADLVARIAAGGDVGPPAAELYRRYGRRLFRFGVRALGDNGLAEEMVQETVAYGRAVRREKSSVGTYLYVIARSVAADVRKRPSSRPLQPVDDVEVPPQPDSVDQIVDSMVIDRASSRLS